MKLILVFILDFYLWMFNLKMDVLILNGYAELNYDGFVFVYV